MQVFWLCLQYFDFYKTLNVAISFTVTRYLNVQFILELGNNGVNTLLKNKRSQSQD
jgi:hypothetical protein